jgi:hypothetical protein
VWRRKNVHIPAADLIAPTSLSTRNLTEAAHEARELFTLLAGLPVSKRAFVNCLESSSVLVLLAQL